MYLSVVGRLTTVIEVDPGVEEVNLGIIWVDTHPECQVKPCDIDILGPLNSYLGADKAVRYLRVSEIEHTPFDARSQNPQMKVFFATWTEEGTNHSLPRGVASADPIYLVGDNGKTVAKVN